MCGIFCSLCTSCKQEKISADEDIFRVVSDKLKCANAARGGPFHVTFTYAETRLEASSYLENWMYHVGPDAGHATSVTFPIRSAGSCGTESAISRGHILELYASELRLRGNVPIVQPHIGGGDVLCWNGEVRKSVVNVRTHWSMLIALHPGCHS